MGDHRTDLPAALDEIERLRTEARHLREHVEQLQEQKRDLINRLPEHTKTMASLYASKVIASEQREELAGLRAELACLRSGIKRFYVVWAPHLPPSWREHFEELMGEKPFLGSAGGEP